MKHRRKLDPKVDLAGAAPETLAAALLRNRNPALRSPQVGKPVVGDRIAVEKVATDHFGDGISHLNKGV